MLREFFRAYRKMAVFMILPHLYQKILTSRILGLSGNKDLISGMTPIRKTFEQEFLEELAELQKAAMESGLEKAIRNGNMDEILKFPDFHEKLQRFAEKWAYYTCENYAFHNGLSASDVIKLIKQPYQQKQEKPQKMPELPQEVKGDVEFLRYMIYLRTERLKIFRIANYNSMGLIMSVAATMGLTARESSGLTYQEIEDFIKGKSLTSGESEQGMNWA